MFEEDRKTLGELFLIIGSFIFVETTISPIIKLAKNSIEVWVLPLFSIGLIIAGTELIRGVKNSFFTAVHQILLGSSILLVVLFRVEILSIQQFLWLIFIISLDMIAIGLTQMVLLKKTLISEKS